MITVSNFKLACGFPCSWSHVPFPFFQSFIQMERPTFTPIIACNGPIDGLRNNIVQQAIAIGASHLIMMDLDQTYPIETITKLLAHKLPVVGCMVHRRYPPFDPLMLKGDINTYQDITEWEEGELVEVDATGTGCLMFNMQLFHELNKKAVLEIEAFNELKPTPQQIADMPDNMQKYVTELEKRYIPENVPGRWFKFRPNPNPDHPGVVGEDIGFCSDLREAGVEIYVDTSIQCGHLSTMEITRDTHLLYKALKNKQQQNKQRQNKQQQMEVQNGN